MSLTKLISKLGFNPADFRDEIEALGDQEDQYFHRSNFQGSYKGVFDIKTSFDGEKIFRFALNQQNGTGPMSYWSSDEKLVGGKWVVVCADIPYYGCRLYPSKFVRHPAR